MAREFSQKFYQSKEWKSTRKAFIASVHGLCFKCRKSGSIVHHIKHLTPNNIDDAYITLGWDNLMFLCIECHNSIHAGSQPIRQDVYFNDVGQLVKR